MAYMKFKHNTGFGMIPNDHNLDLNMPNITFNVEHDVHFPNVGYFAIQFMICMLQVTFPFWIVLNRIPI